ncbi:MAG TPA: exopolysaccharide Pel transporter PelG [Thermoanaerobaculia bacterium]|nr:exopolysaccharide Pel transporter PelG [Thermoanaerobaculia bacterium]
MSAEAAAPALDELGKRVIDTIGMPKDAWEIAAQLEVIGMRDHDARSGYGVRDLFELAHAIERRFREGVYGFEFEGDDPRKRQIPALRFLRRYFAGIAFALPMALQAAAMLLWGYGIWGALDLELAQGSAIALGFIASYIAAGGFAQAIVRRGLFYIYQEEEGLARWTAWRGFALALRATLALIAPALLLNLAFRMLPWPMAFIAAAFYAGLTVLWLAWALLYLVRRTELLAVITAASLAVVIAAANLGAAPIVANMIGVVFADALSLVTARFFLRRMARKRGNAEPVNPPRLAVLVFSTSRYFVYGLLFNAFLFADRVIAWTTPVGREDFPPYGFWLNVRYELAMDLALVVVIVMGGVVQYAIERFSEKLIPHEKEALRADMFVQRQLKAHRRRTWQLALSALIGLALAWWLVQALRGVPNARFQEALTAAVTMRVFVAAAIGYVFFMFAVRNLLLLLTLSRIDDAVRAVLIALVTNVIVGFICSRSIAYWCAVAGLVAGAIVLSIFAARAARRVLQDLDYSYYAAY